MSDKTDPKVVNINREPDPGRAPDPGRQAQTADADFLARVVEQTVQQIEARAPRVSPFNLATFDDVIRFAEHTAKSGLCPKDFIGKPDDIISAVLWGKELGLPAMTALASIAVVNGRPTVWGEAVAGLCYGTGQVEDVQERFEGEPGSDDYTAICIVKRKAIPTPHIGQFSAADVRRAGLKSVHLTYPRDMLMWKARHRAWHAAFPDKLKGIPTTEVAREEAESERGDMPRPERSWFAKRPQFDNGWNVTWFNTAIERLLVPDNRQDWLKMLVACLQEAPTLRDVDELDNMEQTQTIIGGLPENYRARVEEVFGEARKRFITTEPPPKPEGGGDKPPADAPVDQSEKQQTPKPETKRQRRDPGPAREAKPPTQTTQESPANTRVTPEQAAQFDAGPAGEAAPPAPTFDYFLCGADGAPHTDDTYDDPLTWAREYVRLYEKAPDDQREALVAHNADAIADATAMDPAAALVLLDAEPAEATPAGHAVIPMPIERGRPVPAQYYRDMKAALTACTAADLNAWVDAQRATLDTAPQSARMQVIKAIVARAEELSIPTPNGFAASQAVGAEDKDGKISAAILEHLDTLKDVNAVIAYSNEATVKVPLDRWTRDKPELAMMVRSSFAGHIEMLRASA